ncbi:MAG: class II glutamine amidotransferase [Alphaproteobacteria bacterium]
MCRFVMYLGEPVVLETLLAKPVNSLINQSWDAEERDPLNGDGFGVAWYAHEIRPQPAVFKSPTPAWNNRNLLQLGRVTRSSCVLAHVRAATPGVIVSESNCHPFVWDKFAFMHNGDIAGFSAIRRSLVASLSEAAFSILEGQTDSEHLFALFLDCLWARKEPDGLEAMARALEDAIHRLHRLMIEKGVAPNTQLNLAVSDGTQAVAIRCATGEAKMPTLYWHEGRRYVCENGFGRMIDYDECCETVIIASEPLSNDPGWELLHPNSMILVAPDHEVALRMLRVGENSTNTAAAVGS